MAIVAASSVPPGGTGFEWGAGMDGLVFHLKRAWQSVLYRFCVGEVAPFGLTPARFDMMTAIGSNGVTQARLRMLLGVSRPVVSRMLAALEKLGFVVRGARALGRTRSVELTAEGIARLWRAGEGLVGDFGRVRERIGRALEPDDPILYGVEGRATLEHWLQTLRKGMGDFADLAFRTQLDGIEDWD
jgi:DNA-binding MarR family transcriptional regulator